MRSMLKILSCLMFVAVVANPAFAFEFRSVSEGAAVLYDAPSAKSNKLFVISRDYPVEVLVPVEGWSKVRDASGKLAWIETKSLSDKRTILVNVELAEIRQTPDAAAPIVFQAQQSVVLELVEFSVPGWIKVHHRDGQSGFLKIDQVWGI